MDAYIPPSRQLPCPENVSVTITKRCYRPYAGADYWGSEWDVSYNGWTLARLDYPEALASMISVLEHRRFKYYHAVPTRDLEYTREIERVRNRLDPLMEFKVSRWCECARTNYETVSEHHKINWDGVAEDRPFINPNLP